ncbi:MAG: hypothetical protein KC910_22230 [Candidatus Eremiobacteraeota bacterium]|nr:hypothetical protein [Candidatus Eremiobacteraeota bacterium]
MDRLFEPTPPKEPVKPEPTLGYRLDQVLDQAWLGAGALGLGAGLLAGPTAGWLGTSAGLVAGACALPPLALGGVAAGLGVSSLLGLDDDSLPALVGGIVGGVGALAGGFLIGHGAHGLLVSAALAIPAAVGAGGLAALALDGRDHLDAYYQHQDRLLEYESAKLGYQDQLSEYQKKLAAYRSTLARRDLDLELTDQRLVVGDVEVEVSPQ